MANRVTLNNVITNLRAIADAHKQINSFGFGDVWEINTSGDIVYPQMFAVLEPVTIGNNIETVNFTLLFMDRVKKGEVNEQEVLSDQLEIAKDVIAQLKYQSYDWDFATGTVTLTDFTERFEDDVSGFSMNVSLELPFNANRCVIPTTDTAVTSGANCGSNAGGTINVYVDGSLVSSTSSSDLDNETININL
jgi:hypothetical protein